MREKRRQLLELKKRGKARARTLMYHVATESDVLEILTEFTIDFLLKVIIATWVVEPWTFWCLKFYFIIIFLLFFFFQGYFTLQTDIYQIITSRRRSDSALVKYKAIEQIFLVILYLLQYIVFVLSVKYEDVCFGWDSSLNGYIQYVSWQRKVIFL